MALRPDILRYKSDFDRLYSKGKSSGDKYVVVLYMSNGQDHSRKAFLASKKVGGAVARNRARRLMRESFRKLEQKIKPGNDILMIARKTITSACQAEVEASMRKALIKNGLLS